MQERAEQLLRHVPNIIVKTRAELEADGYDSDQVYQVADDGDDASVS